MGTNDGTVKGKKVFDCDDGFGSFVRGKNVSVGDFPERDILADDSDEEEAGGSAAALTAEKAEDEDEI